MATIDNRFDEKAIEIVRDYITEHLDKSDPIPDFTVYIVYKRYLNYHLKYFLTSTLSDGMYYDLLHIANENEWHLNVFKRVDNAVVKEE